MTLLSLLATVYLTSVQLATVLMSFFAVYPNFLFYKLFKHHYPRYLHVFIREMVHDQPQVTILSKSMGIWFCIDLAAIIKTCLAGLIFAFK